MNIRKLTQFLVMSSFLSAVASVSCSEELGEKKSNKEASSDENEFSNDDSQAAGAGEQAKNTAQKDKSSSSDATEKPPSDKDSDEDLDDKDKILDIKSVEIAPLNPTIFEAMTCVVNGGEKIDQDLARYSWEVNSEKIEVDDKILAPKYFRLGDTVTCTVKSAKKTVGSKTAATVRELSPSFSVSNGNGLCSNFLIRANYGYQICENFIRTWELINGANAKLLTTVPMEVTSKVAINAGVSDGALYVAKEEVRDVGGRYGLEIYTLANPAMPKLVKFMPFDGRADKAWDIEIQNDVLAMARTPGAMIYDISDRLNPALKAMIPNPITVRTPATAVTPGPPVEYTLGVSISENRLAVAGYRFGSRIYDISNLSSPREIGAANFDLTPPDLKNAANFALGNWSWGWQARISGNRMVTAGDYSAISIYDITDTLNPKKLGAYPATRIFGGNYSKRVEIFDDYVIGNLTANTGVEAEDRGFVVLDIQDPTNIRKVGVFNYMFSNACEPQVTAAYFVLPCTEADKTLIFRR